MPEKRREAERRLAAEWMAENYAATGYHLNYPLGPLPEGMTDERLAFPWLRKVDGLAVVDRAIHLVEFKIWTPWDGLDKLPVYKAALPHTPWLGIAKDYPVRMMLVTPRPNPAIMATARIVAIEVIEVHSDWLDQVVASIEHLWTREGREEMEKKRKLRAWLGLD